MNSIIEDQYNLSKHVHISLDESGNMPDFERAAYIALLIRDKRKEHEAMNNK